MKLSRMLLIAMVTILVVAGSASATTITFDENGNITGPGTSYNGTFPGAGTQYNLLTGSPRIVTGELDLYDPGTGGPCLGCSGVLSDIVVFFQGSTSLSPAVDQIFVFSDGQTFFPNWFYPAINLLETGDNNNNGVVYTAAGPGAYGWTPVYGSGPITYIFTSDGTGPTVPEPGTLAMLIPGLLMVGGAIRRKMRL